MKRNHVCLCVSAKQDNYVNDLLYATVSSVKLELVERNIAAQFELKFNCDITGFLGIQHHWQVNIPAQVLNSLNQKKITIIHGIIREGKQSTLENL